MRIIPTSLERSFPRRRLQVFAELREAKTNVGFQSHVSTSNAGLYAGLFKQAISLEAKSEKAYFYFAKFLDQLMEDAKKRQTAHVSSTSKHMDRMGGKSK